MRVRGLTRSGLQRGFTMVELLVAGAIISVLLVAGALLIHPIDYNPERRNALRWLFMAELDYALKTYKADHGQLPDLPGKLTFIGSDKGQLDLCTVFHPDYLTDLPLDPTGGASVTESTCDKDNAGYTTGLQIQKDAGGKVTIHAPHAELGERITYTRTY